MAKVSRAYACRECGARSPAPLGRCPRCGSWGSLEAQATPAPPAGAPSEPLHELALEDVDALQLERVSSGSSEVDRVLGGGWVAGSALLLAGEPGVGKSTLLLQLADASAGAGRSTIYVAGEESPGQVKLRAGRLGVGADLRVTRETDAARLAAYLRTAGPALAIVDSIQTLSSDDGPAAGSPSMVRDATALLTRAAKEAGTTLVLIGHVTKHGAIAGPKLIEHVVDATFALESAAGLRVLRSLKNRFGPTGEVGVFEMAADGLRPVANPSAVFLAERPLGVPGSVVAAVLEGQRPLLVEVQALASKSPYPSPRRVVQGLDGRRVDVVLAVLERRLGLPLEGLDVYVNVAGGLRVTDPGADLAVAVAVVSAVTNRPVPDATAMVGEVGLAGELRQVAQFDRRAREAARAEHPRLIGPPQRTGETSDQHVPVRTVRAALDALWEPS